MLPPHDADQAIFEIARHIALPEARDAYLDEACGADTAQRQRIVELLQAFDEQDSFLESPAIAMNTPETIDHASSQQPGQRIGPYKLLEQIGEGGMGTVWLAEQHEPVRRRVALKLIKPGMDSRQVMARFDAERQALSMMDHPNIARVLDAGTTGNGLPYFVMELVKGQPITQYCDEHHLNPRERLELFLPVCQAIQHAHQKGIIHRDIKPSNVMVAEYDGRPVAKVIDFGVAKAISQPLTERTMFTGLGQIVGTLEYMSPEQARVNQLDVDTRSDVYSLGVLLYELLTGSTPFDRKRLNEAALDELLRIIREEEPPRPSTKLSSSQTLLSIAANRRTEPARLSTLVRGELDWIVMKALEKDRNRRYETANGFATDIQRYLNDDPVIAGPPSRAYRFKKFAWKFRKTLGTAASLGLLLALLAVGAIAWAVHADGQRRLLDQINDELADKNKRLTELSKQEQDAREQAQDRLREALLASARAGRRVREMGRRFRGLESLREAARIRSGSDIRDEAIACLSLVDMRPVSRWPSTNRRHGNAAFYNHLDRYVRVLEDGGLVVEQVADQSEILRLPSLGRSVDDWWLQVSPDDRWLSLLYGPNRELSLVVWDLESRSIRLEVASTGENMVGHDARGRIAYRAPDGSIRIHDLALDREVLRIEDHGMVHPAYFAFHPHRPVLAVCTPSSHHVSLFDTETGELQCRLKLNDSGRYLAWSPDGSLLAVSEEREIAVFYVPAERRVSTLKGHQSLVCFLRFHPQENLLISDSWDDSFRVWDPLSGEQHVRAPGLCKGISPDGTKVAYYHLFHFGLHELAPGIERRVLKERVGMPGNHRALQFDPSGRWLYSGHDYGAAIWDLATHTQLVELPLGAVHDVDWLDATQSLVTTGESGLLRWPTQFLEVDRRFEVGPPAPIGPTPDRYFTELVTERDGGRLFVAVDYAETQVIDVAMSALQHQFSRTVGNVALSSDSRFFACAQTYSEGQVTVWDAWTFEQIVQIPGKPGIRTSIDFSPDSAMLVISDQERIRAYETERWSLLWQQDRAFGFGSNFMIGISPDGTHMAVLEQGVKIRLLELKSGCELATLESNTDMLTDMVFSPNGSQLAAMGGNLTVHLWDLHALRSGLDQLGLNWEALRIPPPAEFPLELAKPPLEVLVEYGPPEMHHARSPLRAVSLGATLDQIQRRLNDDPKDAEAWYLRGLLSLNNRRWHEALVDFDQAIKLDATDGRVYFERGQAHRAIDNDHQAAADFEVALSVGQDGALLCNSLAWIYLAGPADLRKSERALELARQAVEQSPNDTSATNTLGVALYRTGNDEEALRVLVDNAQNPTNLSPLYDWLFAALCYHRMNDTAAAVAAMKQVQELEHVIAQYSTSLQKEWARLKEEAAILLRMNESPPEALSQAAIDKDQVVAECDE